MNFPTRKLTHPRRPSADCVMAHSLAVAVFALLAATPLMAQTLPPGVQTPAVTAAKESFVVQPKNVAAGAKDATIRLVCNTASGFNTSSSKPPVLKFSAGATLKTGSFALLNVNEAECKIDVDADAFGTIDVSLELYSVNGTKVLSTLRGTMGVIGQAAVSGSAASVGAESVNLVQVNSTAQQVAGNLVISGKITGTVSITAPTGTQFSKSPVVVITGGTAVSPALGTNNTVFSFGIGNPGQADITARVTEISYNTQLFGLAGGVEGALACEVSGAALSGQSALVVNAHTAKTTVAGTNDNAESQPSNGQTPSTDPAPDTTQPAASINNPGSSSGSRNLQDSTRQPRNRNNTQNSGGSNVVQPGASAAPNRPSAQGPSVLPSQPGMQPAPPAPGPSAGGATPAGGATGERNASDGTMKPGKAEPTPEPGTTSSKKLPIEAADATMVVTPGLYFCDKDFKPLGAVVLDKSVSGEAGSRVWIVLRRAKDKDPTKVESITVKLTVCGVTRELNLTETSKDSGEFRCAKEGVLLLAAENPDSNTEASEATPPKMRMPR